MLGLGETFASVGLGTQLIRIAMCSSQYTYLGSGTCHIALNCCTCCPPELLKHQPQEHSNIWRRRVEMQTAKDSAWPRPAGQQEPLGMAIHNRWCLLANVSVARRPAQPPILMHNVLFGLTRWCILTYCTGGPGSQCTRRPAHLVVMAAPHKEQAACRSARTRTRAQACCFTPQTEQLLWCGPCREVACWHTTACGAGLGGRVCNNV